VRKMRYLLIALMTVFLMTGTAAAEETTKYHTPDGKNVGFADHQGKSRTIDQEIKNAEKVQREGKKYTGTGVNADGSPIHNDIGYKMDGTSDNPKGKRVGYRGKDGKPITVEQKLKELRSLKENSIEVREKEGQPWNDSRYGKTEELKKKMIKKFGEKGYKQRRVKRQKEEDDRKIAGEKAWKEAQKEAERTRLLDRGMSEKEVDKIEGARNEVDAKREAHQEMIEAQKANR